LGLTCLKNIKLGLGRKLEKQFTFGNRKRFCSGNDRNGAGNFFLNSLSWNLGIASQDFNSFIQSNKRFLTIKRQLQIIYSPTIKQILA